MTYDEILYALTDKNLSVVSERTKIHWVTLSKIRSRGRGMRPHASTLEVLSQYLSGTPYTPDES